MKTKICGDCGLEKSADEYYKDRAAKDGLWWRCKACAEIYRANHVGYVADYRVAHKERIAAYRQTGIREKAQAKRRREHHAAHMTVYRAVGKNELKRSIYCESCGLPAKTEGHHSDYNKPLEVDWLCQTCHIKIHIR